jgi:sRNA-binding protein
VHPPSHVVRKRKKKRKKRKKEKRRTKGERRKVNKRKTTIKRTVKACYRRNRGEIPVFRQCNINEGGNVKDRTGELSTYRTLLYKHLKREVPTQKNVLALYGLPTETSFFIWIYTGSKKNFLNGA